MLVATGPPAQARISSETGRGEHPLLQAIAGRRRVLSAKRVRKQNRSVASLEVALVETADIDQVALEGPAEVPREGGHPIAQARNCPCNCLI